MKFDCFFFIFASIAAFFLFTISFFFASASAWLLCVARDICYVRAIASSSSLWMMLFTKKPISLSFLSLQPSSLNESKSSSAGSVALIV